MGFDFRGQHYRRYVRMGKRTIKDGEAAIIWARNGKCKEIVGPKLQRLFFSTIKFLDRRMATASEYIVVCMRDGEVQHLKGPAVVYENPVRHQNVQVKPCLQLMTPQNCVVVSSSATTATTATTRTNTGSKSDIAARTRSPYPNSSDTNANTIAQNRRVVVGPCQYIPTVDETPLEFSWTETSTLLTGSREDAKKCAPFVILPLMTQQFEVQVAAVTRDTLKSRVSLALSWQIHRVEVTANCEDPVAQLWQALELDATAIAAPHTAEELHNLGVAPFTLLRDYVHTRATAEAIGVQLASINCRELLKPTVMRERLTNMAKSHNSHQTKLDAATRANELADAEVQAQLERTNQTERLEEARFEAAKRREHHEHELLRTKLSNQLSLSTEARGAQVAAAREENAVLVEFLGSLTHLGVDLTTFLTSSAAKDMAHATRAKVTKVAQTFKHGPATVVVSIGSTGTGTGDEGTCLDDPTTNTVPAAHCSSGVPFN